MSEVDEFSSKKILRVYQSVQTKVEFVEVIPEVRRVTDNVITKAEHMETRVLVVDSYDRSLPEPLSVDTPGVN